MKKINIKINKQPHFIGCWNLENNELCKDIVDFFENHKGIQTKGMFSGGYNPKEKKTTDITVNPKDLDKPEYICLKKYIQSLICSLS